VHRPFGQQDQDGGAYVAAPGPAGALSVTASSAATPWAAEAEGETGAEAAASARATEAGTAEAEPGTETGWGGREVRAVRRAEGTAAHVHVFGMCSAALTAAMAPSALVEWVLHEVPPLVGASRSD
jgi:pyruvate/2-oxoglutarate dehydrogenase complex dihydrolipoamide acyltransferase (E2) component